MTMELIRANKDGDLSFVYVWKNDSAKDEFAGRHVKCPACKQPLRIPRPQVEEESYEDAWDWDSYGKNEGDAQPI